ncbi:carboxymuconolactone decarboxylase family protein [Parafilimonas sp.]|uniref:carboxymuconolactone decarboxylase family protein n=1 Tax=Parafilimonas sp. TaxID=1969739 RepID=UPI0039E33CCC
MAHIQLNDDNLPGIIGLMHYSPETAKPLNELAEVLLVSDNSLTRGERELIASSVSYWNDCHFCHTSHGAAAAALLEKPVSLIADIKNGLQQTDVSSKMRALLDIARQVQKGGRHVTTAHIDKAREAGATDKEMHDTVLIAAAFCMYNRYVDGLATWAPDTDEAFMHIGEMLAEKGYVAVTPAETE